MQSLKEARLQSQRSRQTSEIAEARKPVKTAANQRLSTEHTTDIRGGTLSSHFMSHSFPRCCLELLDSSKAEGIYKSESLLLKSARLFSISMSPDCTPRPLFPSFLLRVAMTSVYSIPGATVCARSGGEQCVQE